MINIATATSPTTIPHTFEFWSQHRRMGFGELTIAGDLQRPDCQSAWQPAEEGHRVGYGRGEPHFARPKGGPLPGLEEANFVFHFMSTVFCERLFELEDRCSDRHLDYAAEPLRPRMKAPRCICCNAPREFDYFNPAEHPDYDGEEEEPFLAPIGIIRHRADCWVASYTRMLGRMSCFADAWTQARKAPPEIDHEVIEDRHWD